MNDAKRESMLAAIAALYDGVAETYAEHTTSERHRRGTADQEAFVSWIPYGGRVLDLGFGSGWDIGYFLGHECEVAGMDISRRQVATVRERYPEAEILLGDISRADEYFRPESFDGVWACASVVHMDPPDAVRTMRAMYRLLRPDGTGYLSTKCRVDVNAPEVVEKPSVSSGGVTKRYVYWLPDDLMDRLEETGFVIDDHHYSGME